MCQQSFSAEHPEKIREYLLEAYEFCQNFRTCLRLTVGDHFMPGDFFGCVVGSGKIVRYKEPVLTPAAHITARHVAALVAADKGAFRVCYLGMVELYKIRNELIYADRKKSS